MTYLNTQKNMWHKTKETLPKGYNSIVLYNRNNNKFYEGTWDEDASLVTVNGLSVTPNNFDAWCYRKDVFQKTNLAEIIHKKTI